MQANDVVPARSRVSARGRQKIIILSDNKEMYYFKSQWTAIFMNGYTQ